MKHQTEIKVRFADCDMLGHVNNANYATYMEIARVEYINDVIEPLRSWDETGILLAAYAMDFKVPVYLNDKLIVHTEIVDIGNKSFKMNYDFVVESDTGPIVKANGSTVLVFYDYKKQITLPLPQFWRDKINAFHKTKF